MRSEFLDLSSMMLVGEVVRRSGLLASTNQTYNCQRNRDTGWGEEVRQMVRGKPHHDSLYQHWMSQASTAGGRSGIGVELGLLLQRSESTFAATNETEE